MKTKNIIILSFFLVFFVSFKLEEIHTTRNYLNINEIAINNAVIAFSKSCELYKNDSIFSVLFLDSVYSLAFDRKTAHWHRNIYYDNMVSVTISAHRIGIDCDECCDKFLFNSKTTVGSKGKLPSRFIEENGKLFYWWDDEYPLSEEMLVILWKYNLLCDNKEGLIIIPNYTIDEKQKAAHYYFCKQHLSKHKRILTNIGIGYYKPPKLNCK